MALVFEGVEVSYGELLAMTDKGSGLRVELSQSFCYYLATKGKGGALDQGEGQASGAYVFRPDDTECHPILPSSSSSHLHPSHRHALQPRPRSQSSLSWCAGAWCRRCGRASHRG